MTQLLNTSESVSFVVIFLGPPGSGKGTHAGLLSHFLQIPHVSTGDLFRENIRLKTPVGAIAATYINEGKLVPDEIVLKMLFLRTDHTDCQNGYILDGFPRTVAQGKILDQKLSQHHKIIVLNLYIPDELLVERITGRLGCVHCGRPFHKTYDPPKEKGFCDACGSSLLQRVDDTEEILRKRLNAYRIASEPLIGYYAEKEGSFWHIDAQGTKSQVFERLTKALEVSTKGFQIPSKCQC